MTTTIHSDSWAAMLASDIDAADSHVTITALSALAPRASATIAQTALWRALADAAKRRITIAIGLAAPTLAHPATARNASTAATLIDIGIAVHMIAGHRLLHAKTALVDRRITWTGSGNLTAAAMNHNHELWMRTTDPAVASFVARWHASIGIQHDMPPAAYYYPPR